MTTALRRQAAVVAVLLLVGVLTACGGSSDEGSKGPLVVVTHSILGEVVGEMMGDHGEVETIMPPGADPHSFQASAQQVARMRDADVLIVNGADFEVGLRDVLGSATADGVPTHEAIGPVSKLNFGSTDETDPHFFTDPARMAVAVDGIADFLVANVDGIDENELRARADTYRDELFGLDSDVESTLAGIPDSDRLFVTSHEVFGYFADRYDFEVLGSVIPAGSTTGAADPGGLKALAALATDRGVPAIFADTSSSGTVIDTLATEIGGVAVVDLYSESLGKDDSPGSTYVGMIRTNAERISDALSPQGA